MLVKARMILGIGLLPHRLERVAGVGRAKCFRQECYGPIRCLLRFRGLQQGIAPARGWLTAAMIDGRHMLSEIAFRLSAAAAALRCRRRFILAVGDCLGGAAKQSLDRCQYRLALAPLRRVPDGEASIVLARIPDPALSGAPIPVTAPPLFPLRGGALPRPASVALPRARWSALSAR
jgi:hypothetical protein